MPATLRLTVPDCTTSTHYSTHAEWECISILSYWMDLVTGWNSSGVVTLAQAEVDAIDNSFEAVGDADQSLIFRTQISANANTATNATYADFRTLTEARGVTWIDDYPSLEGTNVDFPHPLDGFLGETHSMRTLAIEVYDWMADYLTYAGSGTETSHGVTYGPCPCTTSSAFGATDHARREHVLMTVLQKVTAQYAEMTIGYGTDAAATATKYDAYDGLGTSLSPTAATSAATIARAEAIADEWEWTASMVYGKLGTVCRAGLAIGSLFTRWTETNAMITTLRNTYPNGWLPMFPTNIEIEYATGGNGSIKTALALAYNGGAGHTQPIGFQAAGAGRQPWVPTVGDPGIYGAQGLVAGWEYALTGTTRSITANGAGEADDTWGSQTIPATAPYGVPLFAELGPDNWANHASTETLVSHGGWTDAGDHTLKAYWLTHANSVNTRTQAFTVHPPADVFVPAAPFGLASNGIRIAVNGSETDVDVEADNAVWTEKIGKVSHTVGGGSWWRDPQPGVATLDVMVPLTKAHKIRTVTIAVTCIPLLASPPTGVIGGGAANSYRIIFHGDVQQVKGSPRAGDTIVQIDAVSEMSGILNRRARTAAANNAGITNLLTDIETAHGLTMNGGNYFPTVAQGFPNCDKPKQKGTSNGEFIRKMLAGTGTNMCEEWEGSITAPTLRWRPDFQDPGTYYTYTANARLWATEMRYPWLYAYPDVGVVYKDFVARVQVEGANSAGAEHYGYGGLASAGQRASVGNREVTVDTWIDTAAECQTQARRLMAYQGNPSYVKMRQVTFNTEHLYRTYLADYTAAQSQYALISLAGGMPGDVYTPRDPFNNTHTTAADWPTHAPSGGALYDTLESLWWPTLAYDVPVVDYVVQHHVVRTLTRTFTPTGGWDVTAGVEPVGLPGGLRGSTIVDYGNGTY